MAVFKTTPVFFCHRCGKPLIGYGETYNDPLGENLSLVAKVLSENAICSDCKNRRLYYIREGRVQDWEAGRA